MAFTDDVAAFRLMGLHFAPPTVPAKAPRAPAARRDRLAAYAVRPAHAARFAMLIDCAAPSPPRSPLSRADLANERDDASRQNFVLRSVWTVYPLAIRQRELLFRMIQGDSG